MAISQGKEAYVAVEMANGKTYYYRGQDSSHSIQGELSSFILKGQQLVKGVDANGKVIYLGSQGIVTVTPVLYANADKTILEALGLEEA